MCRKIDSYLNECVFAADGIIEENGEKKIKDGDVVLTYARYVATDSDLCDEIILVLPRSSVVEKVLLAAHASGRRFSVIVVDSRPLLEGKLFADNLQILAHFFQSGKRLLSALSHAGIECKYLLLPSIGSVITEVSTVIVGAHSIHTNGAVYSRAGTALVAMMAKQHSVPFIVCCETYTSLYYSLSSCNR